MYSTCETSQNNDEERVQRGSKLIGSNSIINQSDVVHCCTLGQSVDSEGLEVIPQLLWYVDDTLEDRQRTKLPANVHAIDNQRFLVSSVM